MNAYIMCGPIGSGKTFVANNLYKHLPHLNPDNFIEGEWSREKANEAWDKVHERIKNYSGISLEFVVDTSQALQISRRRLTQYIREVAPTYGIICVFVKAPFKECLKRNATRERVVAPSVLKKYYDTVMDNPPSRNDGYDHVVVVDNSRYSGNNGAVWTTDEKWPERWYHV